MQVTPQSLVILVLIEGQPMLSVMVTWQPAMMYCALPSSGHAMRPVSHTGRPSAVVER